LSEVGETSKSSEFRPGEDNSNTRLPLLSGLSTTELPSYTFRCIEDGNGNSFPVTIPSKKDGHPVKIETLKEKIFEKVSTPPDFKSRNLILFAVAVKVTGDVVFENNLKPLEKTVMGGNGMPVSDFFLKSPSDDLVSIIVKVPQQ
ncbi:hypothetical protein BGX27_006329, partial [Mortierella sp. AM989]